MKNQSAIRLTLFYLWMKPHLKQVSGQTIHVAMELAKDWFNQNLPSDHKDKVKQIKLDHGFTEESWDEAMAASGSFYFIPTQEMDNCNKAIKDFYSQFMHINRGHDIIEYTYSELSNHAKRGTLNRYKKHGLYYYSLPKEDLKEMLNHLRSYRP